MERNERLGLRQTTACRTSPRPPLRVSARKRLPRPYANSRTRCRVSRAKNGLCLEKPADLVVCVLRENPGWDMDRVHATMNGTPNQQANLAHPIRVLIVYANRDRN